MSLSGENEEGSTPSSICEETEEEATASGMSLSGSEGALSHKRSFPAEQDTDRDLKRFKTDQPVSMKSDQSMGHPIFFRAKTDRPVSPAPSGVSMKSDRSMGHPIFFKGELSTRQSSISEKNDQSMDCQPRVLTDDKVYQTVSTKTEIQEKMKSFLKNRTYSLFEGIEDQGKTTPLNNIYTELYITQVVRCSRTALLNECKLTKKSCEALASVLKSNSCCLIVLDLSGNTLQDSGVKLLSAGLEDPHCKLETLKLAGCNITEEGCASLASALRSNPSHLKELDLRGNTPGDSGVKLLSSVREDPLYTLETLRLND
ncbi:hypothetical protein J4Q44_G00391950 [Coregonus suidteri]|uniref:FISNA domain-containing protein n=1 Tax=Coregonus suidteri TaxID=861788 RepID=A0AAN8QII2_9TELE